MQTKLIFLIFSVFVFNLANSQILLPKGFICVSMSAETNMRDNYFSNGMYRFHSEAWGREIQDLSEIVDLIKKNYENKLKFRKTQDNLYWGTGVYNNEYIYIIILPSKAISIALISKTNGSQFSNYSAWLLQQVRINISANKDCYFTDILGKECL